ncbi:hypothetical protein ACTMU2_01840 [Cupriavidus basilensis]
MLRACYEPGAWIARVSPTPLLMIVALQDTITLTDLELAAYEGGPLSRSASRRSPVAASDPCVARFDQSSAAALDWFKEHLA